jgi:hypothetical protein
MVTSPLPAGIFSFSSTDVHWSWSDGMFTLHGMQPGEVVPTRAVFLSHVHRDDRPAVEELLDASSLPKADPHAIGYRLVDLNGDVRDVTLALRTVGGREATTVLGFVVDESERRKRAVAAGVDEELRQALESHAAIDQAKGMIMLAYGGNDVEAFDRLRQASQHNNIKVRSLADGLVARGRTAGSVAALRAEMDKLLADRSTPGAARRAMTRAVAGETDAGLN